MESRFDITDFENSLKEHADRFVIEPSAKVWKGIYNDLHPGSKWPSLAMGLLMILTLFWMGNNQKNNSETIAGNNNNEKAITSSENQSDVSNNPSSALKIVASNAEQKSGLSTKNIEGEDNSSTADMHSNASSAFKILKGGKSGGEQIQTEIGVHSNKNDAVVQKVATGNTYGFDNSILSEKQNTGIISEDGNGFRINHDNIIQLNSNLPVNPKISLTKTGNTVGNEMLSTITSEPPKPVLKKKKKNDKVEWIYFITPSISSVYFRGNNLNKPSSSNGGVVVNPVSKHEVIHSPKIGIQAGADVNYKLGKSAELTSGLRMAYSGYKITSNFAHPTLTTVTFQDADGNLFVKNYMTHYGNGKGAGKFDISNYSLEFGIPVGVQWNVWGNDNVKISFVSSVEPFVVLGSRAYILSGDGNNYVNDPDLIRRMNLSGNIGSVISFHGAGANWHIGPSVRYQILSTYHNIYPVKEHLVNYGIRLGVSKKD